MILSGISLSIWAPIILITNLSIPGFVYSWLWYKSNDTPSLLKWVHSTKPLLLAQTYSCVVANFSKAFKEVIALRTQSIAEFDILERDIKLIGDWYQARLYDLVSKKLKIGEWRQSIKDKLDSLEDIYSIVVEKFSVSKLHSLELIQIFLFFVLQAGWFALIILEFFYFTSQ